MRRTFVALVLAVSLVTPAPPGLFDRLWALLSARWSAAVSLPAQRQTKEGCGMDPNGLCKTAPQPQSEAGCGMDPSGQCNPGS
jgi:hypothetical protein